jgi:predicted HAD superfamily Cof-like phosphohydrolase
VFQAFKDVIRFEQALGTKLSDEPPAVPDPETIYFCNDLVAEETDEFFVAMSEGDLPKIADAIADSIWVLNVAAVRLGINLPAVWEEVKRTNMAKFGPGSWRREDGKLMKPPGWTAPDIEGVLLRQASLDHSYGGVVATGSRQAFAESVAALGSTFVSSE